MIVIPAYNEEANVAAVVADWHAVAARIVAEGGDAILVVANDGSRDRTSAILHGLETDYPLLRVLDKPNSGHGATVMALYRHAIAAGADYVFQTDSDGQTLPEEFWPMWAARADWNFQIGLRRGRQDGAMRVVVTKVLKLVVRLTMGVTVPDANTPFRLMAVRRLARVMDRVPDDFFLANVAVAALALRSGERCRWVPVTFRPRQGGTNSINLRRICRIGRQAVVELRRIGRAE